MHVYTYMYVYIYIYGYVCLYIFIYVGIVLPIKNAGSFHSFFCKRLPGGNNRMDGNQWLISWLSEIVKQEDPEASWLKDS